MLQSSEPDSYSEDRFFALKEAANTVGVKINIDGEVPPEYSDLLAVAIHECLTNTVKHAGGRRLDVRIENDGQSLTATLTNDGRPPAVEITESGGLKNLRAITEKHGGTMKIELRPAFTLILAFGK